MALKKSTYVL